MAFKSSTDFTTRLELLLAAHDIADPPSAGENMRPAPPPKPSLVEQLPVSGGKRQREEMELVSEDEAQPEEQQVEEGEDEGASPAETEETEEERVRREKKERKRARKEARRLSGGKSERKEKKKKKRKRSSVEGQEEA
jgi:hypothetical protein